MDSLNKELETRTDYESDAYMSIITKVAELGEKYYALEEINYEAEVEKALRGLGFKRSDLHRPTSEFSGGWRMRIELAKLLLQKPDLILLDLRLPDMTGMDVLHAVKKSQPDVPISRAETPPCIPVPALLKGKTERKKV